MNKLFDKLQFNLSVEIDPVFPPRNATKFLRNKNFWNILPSGEFISPQCTTGTSIHKLLIALLGKADSLTRTI